MKSPKIQIGIHILDNEVNYAFSNIAFVHSVTISKEKNILGLVTDSDYILILSCIVYVLHITFIVSYII